MTNTKLLVGSLSNDLFRVATLTQRGSIISARRFLQEARRWAEPLANQTDKEYIRKIARIVIATDNSDISLATAEQYLMFGILLQNHALYS